VFSTLWARRGGWSWFDPGIGTRLSLKALAAAHTVVRRFWHNRFRQDPAKVWRRRLIQVLFSPRV
jgi:hypothetical protein